MNRVDEILSKISDFKGMIKDTSRQLFELENRIIFGALTPEEARSYKERWEDNNIKRREN